VSSALVLLGAAASVAACKSNPVCVFRDTINKPESRTERRALLAQGLDTFCKQMTTRNAPLRMTEDTPLIGRFYPKDCRQRELDSGNLYVELSGFGYAWTNVSKKVTFTMSASVEYNQDFLVAKDECDIYAYFRTQRIVASNFTINKIERQMAQFFNALSPMGDTFGKQLVTGKLAEGFTVIHDHDNHDDVGMGLVPVGKRPSHPFDVRGSDRFTYENLRAEVHQNERDFIGPIEVTDANRSLYLVVQIDGAPVLDVAVLRKDEGEAALRAYYDYPEATAVQATPLFADVVQQGVPFQRAVPVPPGQYYVVLDNTATMGRVAPAGNVLDDRAVLVNYVVQIGDHT
jgi:hypothetical protein